MCADALHAPFREASFDAIFCNNILEHLNSYQAYRLFREIRYMLKKDGVVVVRTPDYQLVQETFFDDSTHITPYTTNKLSKVLADCNLQVTFVSTDLIHLLVPPKPGNLIDPLMSVLLKKFKVGNILCIAKKNFY